MRYFIIAGEPSGDVHAGNLMKAICEVDSQAQFMGMGGRHMIDQGLQCVANIENYSIMGFIEVLRRYFDIRKLFTKLKSALIDFKPDKVILVDYGGFNLRMARFVKENRIPVHYYILPKVWAWNEKRVRHIKKYVDHAYVIFPFEEQYFRSHGVNAFYVGNPVAESIDEFNKNHQKPTPVRNQIALLPGSRKQEIQRILPKLLAIVGQHIDKNFVIALGEKTEHLPKMLPTNVSVEVGNTFDVVRKSELAIVTSGTANLETALLGTPQIVVYQANSISYAIGKHLVKIKYISPVNLILNREACPELIQTEFNTVNLNNWIAKLHTGPFKQKMVSDYADLNQEIGNFRASTETAQQIVNS